MTTTTPKREMPKYWPRSNAPSIFSKVLFVLLAIHGAIRIFGDRDQCLRKIER